MNNTIHIFIGPQSEFDKYLEEKIEEGAEILYFMQLIKDYNANLRQEHRYLHGDIDVENLIVNANDYASVYEHVVQNFITIVTTNHNVENTFLHNPPDRIIKALYASYKDRIYFENTKYKQVDEALLKEIWGRLKIKIVGQENSKKEVLSNLNKLCSPKRVKPVVLLFYGESGVGKTETAKEISTVLGGELTRIQFSMMQTLEANNYVFGAEHSKSSLAKDLLARESNIVLIDEFDKVHPNFYNAFYQMFDEGIFVDTNYSVALEKCIFICTSNFKNSEEAMSKLGMSIYSRFDNLIKFDSLAKNHKEIIMRNHYENCLDDLDGEKRKYIEETDILDWHIENIEKLKNVRTIRNSLERAINMKIIEKYIID